MELKSTEVPAKRHPKHIKAERDALGIPGVSHPLHTTWMTMKARCNRPTATNYDNYGGRGIKVCDQWNDDFAAFYLWAVDSEWQSGLQLDRINNDGPYAPGNCRWVTPLFNINNRRVTPRYSYKGSLLSAREIYDDLVPPVSYDAFRARLKLGWTVERASGPYERKNNAS